MTKAPAATAATPAAEGNAAHAIAIRQGFRDLLEAVHAGNADAFQDAAKSFSRADLAELKDSYGRTVLHHAAQQGHTSICTYMVERLDMDINTQDQTGACTRLLIAWAHGHDAWAALHGHQGMSGLPRMPCNGIKPHTMAT